jgi:predicted nucleic acid-binding Zn ribbon protein
MPTYVYKFVDTGETIEVQQSFDDPTLTEVAHPSTGEPMAVKKVFTPVGVTFKGGGFYKTDSRGGSATKSASTSTSSAAPDSSSSTSTGSGSSTSSTTATSTPSTGSSSSSSD